CPSQERFLSMDRRIQYAARRHRNLEHKVRWSLCSPPRYICPSAAAEAESPPNARFLRPGPALEEAVSRPARHARQRLSKPRRDFECTRCGILYGAQRRLDVAFLRRITRTASGGARPRAG